MDASKNQTRPKLPRLPLTINPQTKEDLTDRTIEACRRCGIPPSQLLPPEHGKNPYFNANAALPSSVMKLRKEFAENERLNLLQQVDEVRNDLIESNWEPYTQEPPSPKARPATSCPVRPASSRSLIHSSSARSIDINFVKAEKVRTKQAHKHQMKLNKVLSKKWKEEANRAATIKQLSPKIQNTEKQAWMRHMNYIQGVQQTAREKNKEREHRTMEALQSIEHELQHKRKKLQSQQQLSEKHMRLAKRNSNKQHKEWIERQNRRLKEHQMSHEQRLKQQQQRRLQRHANTQSRRKLAEAQQAERRQELLWKQAAERKQRKQKLRETMKRKRLREEQLRQRVQAKNVRLDARMKELDEQKEATRLRLEARRPVGRGGRVSLVERAVEGKKDVFRQIQGQKEKEWEQRLEEHRRQKQEELLLKRELNKLKEKRRVLRMKRKRKREELERRELQRKWKEKEQRLTFREQMRENVVEKQRVYNERVHLLRTQLSWQFQNLTENDITSPVAMKKFTHQLTDSESLERYTQLKPE